MTDKTTQFAGNTSHIALMQRPYGPRLHMDENAVTAAPEPLPLPADAPESFDSPEAAARYMNALPEKRQKSNDESPSEFNKRARALMAGEPDKELPDEGNAALPETEATGETQEQDPAEEPPIPLPRSWAKEQAEHWEALPRATQEYLIAQDSKASAAVRQAQNEAAEKLKGLTVKEQQAEEARQKYEAKLPEVVQGLVDKNNRDYSLITSQASVDALENEIFRLTSQARMLVASDPIQAQQIMADRDEISVYLQGWRNLQSTLAQRTAELDQTNQRKTQKEQADWAEFISTNNAKAAERIPELADPEKSQALTTKAGDLLRTIGFTEDDLNGFQRGEKISPYDHRMQDLIFKAIQAQDIQQAKAAIPGKLAKPLPPVQRPGVARGPGAGVSERIQALDSKLTNSGSLDDAFALLSAKRSQRRA
jgi:hypothetical protein